MLMGMLPVHRHYTQHPGLAATAAAAAAAAEQAEPAPEPVDAGPPDDSSTAHAVAVVLVGPPEVAAGMVAQVAWLVSEEEMVGSVAAGDLDMGTEQAQRDPGQLEELGLVVD